MSWYFGERWGAPILEGFLQVPTPIGEPCMFCVEPFVDGDQGLYLHSERCTPGPCGRGRPTHRECFVRSIVGGIAHLEGRCTCCGGTVDPDDGLGWRESARRVLAKNNMGI